MCAHKSSVIKSTGKIPADDVYHFLGISPFLFFLILFYCYPFYLFF